MHATCTNLICCETGLNVDGKMRNLFVVRFTVALSIHGPNHSQKRTIIIKHFIIQHDLSFFHSPQRPLCLQINTLCEEVCLSKLAQTSVRRWPYNKSFCSLVLVLCHLHKNRIQHHYETFLRRSPIMMHFKNCYITIGLADNSTAWIIRRYLGIFPRGKRWIRDTVQEWVFVLY